MIQQHSLDEALELLSELSDEVKRHSNQKQNDAEFSIQKGSIVKIRTLLASLDKMFNPTKIASMNGNW